MEAHYSGDECGRPSSATSNGSAHGRCSGKSVGARRLLELVEEIYKSFNPGKVTLDTHLDTCLGTLQLANTHDDTFIRQVVYGIVRYRSFLGCIMDSFYHYNGGIALREDMDMYKIFGYLTIFRMEELGHTNLKRLVDAKEPQKMVVFFRYLFNPHYLQNALRDDWLKLYDKQFVDGIIERLQLAAPEMGLLLDTLDDKVYFTRKRADNGRLSMSGVTAAAPTVVSTTTAAGTTGASGATQGTMARVATVPQPFNLSQPRPKPCQVEVPLPHGLKARPAPKQMEGPSKEQLALQAANEANKQRAANLLANASPFKLRCLERPTTLDKIKAEIEADLERQLTFQPAKANPVPAAPTAQVRLNAAAVLREDARYRKRQAEEASMLQRYEAELRDESVFRAWQQDMLKQDEAARQAAVEARRVAMAAVQDAAAKAKAAQVASNLELGRQLKEEAQAIAAALSAEKEEELRQKQVQCAAVAESRAAVGVAAERLVTEKRSAAEEERQRQASARKALMENQLRENAEKRDIVMQLRALETVPRQRVAEFDPTTTPDHGLLESMPMVELQERLVVAKRRAKEEEERRRAANLASRQEREALLLSKAANIQRIRKVAAAQASVRRDAAAVAAAKEAQAAVVVHENQVLVLTEKLDAKRAATQLERARIAAETRKIRFEQMQQAAGGEAVEANKFRELRAGAAREAADRQTGALQGANTYERTRAKAKQVRMKTVKTEAKTKADFLKEYDERVATLHNQWHIDCDKQATRRKQQAAVRHASEQAAQEMRRALVNAIHAPSKLIALAQGAGEGHGTLD